jgi:hypothetical protein
MLWSITSSFQTSSFEKLAAIVTAASQNVNEAFKLKLSGLRTPKPGRAAK